MEGEMDETKKCRKKYFLKDSPQPKLIFGIYFILACVMIVSGAVFYFIGNKDLTAEYFKAHSTLKTTLGLLLPALVAVNFFGLMGALGLIIAFTHSIAGPI